MRKIHCNCPTQALYIVYSVPLDKIIDLYVIQYFAIILKYYQDIKSIEFILGNNYFIFGSRATNVDCACYSFLSCIYFYQIDTPLKVFISRSMMLYKYIERVKKQLGKA